MRAFIIIIMTSVGGWGGWWLGYHVGLFTALALSMIGTGAGLFYGRKFNQMYN